MIGRVGIPEILVIMMFGFFWIIPLAAGVWALVTLHRIRTSQEDVRRRLEAIERSLQRTMPN